SFLGDLCFGPSQGQNVTFVRPDQWVKGWRDVPSEGAYEELLRRFLSTYGPATRDEFALWFGVEPKDVRPIFELLAPELTQVQVEKYKAWALISTLDDIRSAQEEQIVRLLPLFDLYTIIFSPHNSPHILPTEFRPRVYRKS